MHYVKVKDPHGSYADTKSKVFIRRGEIVAVETLTEPMKSRIRATGLLEVSKEAYDSYLKSKSQQTQANVESPELPSGAPLAETPQSNPVGESLGEELDKLVKTTPSPDEPKKAAKKK